MPIKKVNGWVSKGTKLKFTKGNKAENKNKSEILDSNFLLLSIGVICKIQNVNLHHFLISNCLTENLNYKKI